MVPAQHIDNEFSARFFADLYQIYPKSSRQYRCTDISDIHYCQLGVLRCLGNSTTGHEFLQFHADQGMADIEPGHFFKALKSSRRLANTTSLNGLLAQPMKRRIADPYAQCKELDDWDLYAVDGHYHQAACFDPKRGNSKGELRATATGHFFRMNMRTHHLSCLGMANPEDGKKKAHDIRDELEEKKQQGRTKMAVAAAVAAGIVRAAGNFINTALHRATQRTQRFIRWVRVWIYKQAPWRDSIARLRQVWATTSA